MDVLYETRIAPALQKQSEAIATQGLHALEVLAAAPDPHWIELMSLAERVLNFGHTGSARVLHRRTGETLWICISVAEGYMPVFAPAVKIRHNNGNLTPEFPAAKWPLDLKTRLPLSSAQRAIEWSYGVRHYTVCDVYAL